MSLLAPTNKKVCSIAEFLIVNFKINDFVTFGVEMKPLYNLPQDFIDTINELDRRHCNPQVINNVTVNDCKKNIDETLRIFNHNGRTRCSINHLRLCASFAKCVSLFSDLIGKCDPHQQEDEQMVGLNRYGVFQKTLAAAKDIAEFSRKEDEIVSEYRI
eukprot:TRINITY_DN93867_c0_g1_i2.p1 TRINITY_DN93867_c0_g1~~TRINITY_DN93867_c0_g1_i2.p1  ORF type:complete len:159 (-),score=47.51 TRINITY_DN93867_c0_g1_i2:158-634(-)